MRGETERVFESLVNAHRDVGAVEVHGISAAELADAPTFEEIAGDILETLDGSVIAGHNIRFDLSFLEAEFRRAGISFPARRSYICTMDLAAAFCPDRRNLEGCCSRLGVEYAGQHHAVDDARATAQLLVAMAAANPELVGHIRPSDAARFAFPYQPSRHSVSRQRAEAMVHEHRGYLGRLVAQLPFAVGLEKAADSRAVMSYVAILDRALEDRFISRAEAESLAAFAADWGIDAAAVRAIHASYLGTLVQAALADGIISDSERRDLEAVAEWLSIPTSHLDEVAGHRNSTPSNSPASTMHKQGLAGNSICFTGKLVCTIGGEEITRDRAEDLARQSGLAVSPNVTKKLDILVIADPQTLSGKAEKAREYGTRIIAEQVFWSMIGVAVD